MITKISNGIVLADGKEQNTNLYIEDDKILALTDENLPFDKEIDAKGLYVSPGFVDMHLHGAAGHDFLEGTAEAYQCISAAVAQHGTTAIAPTLTTSALESILVSIEKFEEALAAGVPGAKLLGIHLEGPYFAYGQRGAQDPRHLRNPQPEEYNQILDRCPKILRWSVAPELPGALELGQELKKRGILAAIGHSDAGYAEVEAAWNNGYTHVTHLYSGMSVLHRRNAYRYVGVLESAYLIDDMTVEIIADGCHLPAELLKFVYKFKGPEKTALITDSMRGAGMPDGPSMLGHWRDGLETIIEDGVAKLPDRTSFAGSVATFDRLVRNMLNMAQVPLHEVITMACTTPAKIMGFHDRGVLAPGLRADVILFDDNIHVSHVIVGGRTIYTEE